MSTATETITGPTTTREITAAFLAAVVAYRNAYWSCEFKALPALEANRRANDLIGYRWFKATDGGKRAVVRLIAWHWPEMASLPEKTRFVMAVRESALGCLR